MNTPDVSWHPLFIRALEMTGNVRLACRTASVTRSIAYEHYNKSLADAEEHPDAPPYSELRPYGNLADQWDEAKEDALDRLEKALWDRAERTDTTAAIFLLKAHRREQYGDRVTQEIANANNKPFETTQTIRLTADTELTTWRADQQNKLQAMLDAGPPEEGQPPSASG